MKCPRCSSAMVALFTSWACDPCEARAREQAQSPIKTAWLALFHLDGTEVTRPEYRRVNVPYEVVDGWVHTKLPEHSPPSFPMAASNWGLVSEIRLMVDKAEQGCLARWNLVPTVVPMTGYTLFFARQFDAVPLQEAA